MRVIAESDFEESRPYLAHLLPQVFEVRLPFCLLLLVLRWLDETTEREVPTSRFSKVLRAWISIRADIRMSAISIATLAAGDLAQAGAWPTESEQQLVSFCSILGPDASLRHRQQHIITETTEKSRDYGLPSPVHMLLTWMHWLVNSTR